MKRLIALCLIFAASGLRAADLQGGETFADGQSVSGSRLNNHVNGATIRANFISDKSSATPVTVDSFVFYQSGSGTLLRCTLTQLQGGLFTAPTFTGVSTISEAITLTGVISPTQIAANTNDYAPTGFALATTLRLSTDASRNITGLAGGASGRFILVHNVGSFNIVLIDESASSSAPNRFALINDFTVYPDQVVALHYDATSSRWRITGQQITVAPAFTTLTDAATITWTLDPNKAVQNNTVTLGGSRQLAVPTPLNSGMTGVLKVVQDGTGSRKLALPGPNFTDGVGNNTTTFTSATAAFVAGDVGRIISQSGNTNIPAGTTISSRTNATTVVLSATCTTASGITFYLPGRQSLVSGGGSGAISLTTTANSTDILTWVTDDGTNIFWNASKNFN